MRLFLSGDSYLILIKSSTFTWEQTVFILSLNSFRVNGFKEFLFRKKRSQFKILTYTGKTSHTEPKELKRKKLKRWDLYLFEISYIMGVLNFDF